MTYSSSLALGRQRLQEQKTQSRQATARAWGKNQNTTRFKERSRSVGPVSNTIMLIILACLVGLLYLTQVTKTNSYSYRINDLKNQQANLQSQNDQLTIDAARLQSQERVKNSEAANNLVTVAPADTLQN